MTDSETSVRLPMYIKTFSDNPIHQAGVSKFITWELDAMGSGSTSIVLGVKNGMVYEPKVSGRYMRFLPTDDGRFCGFTHDFSQGHAYVENYFSFNEKSKEFVFDSNSKEERPKTNATDGVFKSYRPAVPKEQPATVIDGVFTPYNQEICNAEFLAHLRRTCTTEIKKTASGDFTYVKDLNGAILEGNLLQRAIGKIHYSFSYFHNGKGFIPPEDTDVTFPSSGQPVFRTDVTERVLAGAFYHDDTNPPGLTSDRSEAKKNSVIPYLYRPTSEERMSMMSGSKAQVRVQAEQFRSLFGSLFGGAIDTDVLESSPGEMSFPVDDLLSMPISYFPVERVLRNEDGFLIVEGSLHYYSPASFFHDKHISFRYYFEPNPDSIWDGYSFLAAEYGD